MKCKCGEEMKVTKTTGRAYEYRCFSCGERKTVTRKRRKKRFWLFR